VWLAPVQVTVIPIADRHQSYAGQVAEVLRTAGLRADLDDSPERMNSKIRRAQMQKVPYMWVVGDREMADNGVAVRLRNGVDMGAMPLTDFAAMAEVAVREKAQI
jgi:threonyl-tRNA synthetase